MNFHQISVEVERQEITNLVRNRMQDMGIPQEDYGLFCVSHLFFYLFLFIVQIIVRKREVVFRLL